MYLQGFSGLGASLPVVGLPYITVKREIQRLMEIERASEIVVKLADGRTDFHRRSGPGNLVTLTVNANGIVNSKRVDIRVDSEGVPLRRAIKLPIIILGPAPSGGGGSVDMGPFPWLPPSVDTSPDLDIDIGVSWPTTEIPEVGEVFDIVDPPPRPPRAVTVDLPPLTPQEKYNADRATENIRISPDPGKTIETPQPGTSKAPWLTPQDIKDFIDVVYVGHSEYKKRLLANKMTQSQSAGKPQYLPNDYLDDLEDKKKKDIWPWLLGLAVLAVGGAGYYAIKG